MLQSTTGERMALEGVWAIGSSSAGIDDLETRHDMHAGRRSACAW
jgi:hypothetical protein